MLAGQAGGVLSALLDSDSHDSLPTLQPRQKQSERESSARLLLPHAARRTEVHHSELAVG